MKDPYNKIKVLVVDDHQLIIDGLQNLLAEEPFISVVDGANSGAEALEMMGKMKIDVVLADVNMPEMSGIELTKRIREAFPFVGVIGLTMNDDSSMINQMMSAGASGYVLKSSHINEICDAIRTVASGKSYLSHDVQTILMKHINKKDNGLLGTKNSTSKLSVRETQILNLVAIDLTDDEIASKLSVGKRTIETHRRNIYTKTRTKSLIGLLQYAINNNLIVPFDKNLNDDLSN